MNLPRSPWTYQESKGGKWFVYDATGKPLFSRNVSASRRSAEENAAIDKAISSIPHLLSALRRALEFAEDMQSRADDDLEVVAIIKDALKRSGQ